MLNHFGTVSCIFIIQKSLLCVFISVLGKMFMLLDAECCWNMLWFYMSWNCFHQKNYVRPTIEIFLFVSTNNASVTWKWVYPRVPKLMSTYRMCDSKLMPLITMAISFSIACETKTYETYVSNLNGIEKLIGHPISFCSLCIEYKNLSTNR